MYDGSLYQRCLDRLFSREAKRNFLIDELSELTEDLRESDSDDVDRLILAQIDVLRMILGGRDVPDSPENLHALRVLMARYFVNHDGLINATGYLTGCGLMVDAKPLIENKKEVFYFLLSPVSQMIENGRIGFERGEIIPTVLRPMRKTYYQIILQGFISSMKKLSDVDEDA